MSVNNFGLFFTRDRGGHPPAGEPREAAGSTDTENGDYNVLGIGQIMVPWTPSLKRGDDLILFPGRPFSGC